MKIIEAIKKVMKAKGQAMTSKEVCQQIIGNNLYEFKAADPVHIVNTQIRRHCKGIPEKKSYSKTKHFMSTGGNKYYFIEPPETISKTKKISAKEYWIPAINSLSPISTIEILNGDIEFKTKVLKEWFLSEYAPIKSDLSNYISILDGPYEVLDVLNDEFFEMFMSQQNVISKAAKEIEFKFGYKEWSKIPKDEVVDEYFIENFNTEFYKNFTLAIKNIELLSQQSSLYNDNLQQSLNRMLYGNIITAMESYLSDAFINTVISNEKNIRKIVEKTPELKTRNLNLGDIYSRLESLKDEVHKYLMDLIYHKLDKVKELYYHTLDINFPDNLSIIFKAIINRHDIVHRNGKRKDGGNLTITSDDIKLLLKEVVTLVKKIDTQLK